MPVVLGYHSERKLYPDRPRRLNQILPPEAAAGGELV
jgi:hypothetical protein